MRISLNQYTMSKEIKIIKNQALQAPQFWTEVLLALDNLNVWSTVAAKKLKELLDATTISNSWEIMTDNKVQLEALKLLLKINWIKTDQWLNINLFNMPKPDENLKY